ncbi:XPG domain containing-domain-containing protein [Thelonectria olida]|uniref:XPG domain containing-domain-containing protein n=1 Tax=Thelonectria olida TaxID=1576542 RepID=A0A9P8W318_9HYPO|nr:XPG domain containing-domain-containing protein [Thelonectria olida]
MGIPHLISTLEPFAIHGLLDDQSIVVDGPALAYHVLYICNRNGVVLPSYQLLGDTVVAWLDELVRRRVRVEAIYFDGHLPLGKRLVRMERMAKSFHQLKLAHSVDTKGRPRDYLCSPMHKLLTSDLFSTKAPPGKPFLPPSFHVPAVIDALRLSPRYRPLVRLVPGEADAYCARHLLNSGGTVLTSDSDLLAHDLGSGRVVFLRDIYIDGDSRLACTTFSPSQICERLGLPSSDQICRLAYERRQNPNSSLPQILQECFKPIGHASLYEEFCQEYLHHETAPLPASQSGTPLRIDSLDPRISELVLQFENPSDAKDFSQYKIFLPILIEDPSRGSAWEQTTSVRQLAYTILRHMIPGNSSSVQEYRRVNNTAQKGRKLDLMHKGFTQEFSKALVDLMVGVQSSVDNDVELSWLVFCLIVDIRHCCEEEKQSHCLKMLQRASRTRSYNKVSWDVIHFVGQLQAAYYSFRILHQIISLVPTTEVKSNLHDMLASVPPLTKFPDIDRVIGLLLRTQEIQTLAIVKKFVSLPEEELQQEPRRTRSKQPKASRGGRRAAKASARIDSQTGRNPFEFLAQYD